MTPHSGPGGPSDATHARPLSRMPQIILAVEVRISASSRALVERVVLASRRATLRQGAWLG